MTRQLTSAEAKERIGLVRSAHREERGNFVRLVERARLDPANDLRFGNFSGVNFAGSDLRGYDFTGASLRDCLFVDARISGALFTQAEFASPETDRCFQIESAEDWHDAFFEADKCPVPETPFAFDEHIPVGAYFRDHTRSPVMRCILAAQADGTGRKYAIAVGTRAVDTDMQTGLGKLKSHRGYVDRINELLGLGQVFEYKLIRDDPILLHCPEAHAIAKAGHAVIEPQTGLLNLPHSRKVARDGVLHNHMIDEVASIGGFRPLKIVRRMRELGTELPRRA